MLLRFPGVNTRRAATAKRISTQAVSRQDADYEGYEFLAGPAVDSGNSVTYRRTLSHTELVTLSIRFSCYVIFAGTFIVLLVVRTIPLQSAHLHQGLGWATLLGIVALEGVRVAQTGGLCALAFVGRDPVPFTPARGLRVAMLTTIVPSREPLDVVLPTLHAMRRIDVGYAIDVWLLDEGDSDEVRALCAANNIKHFSRRGAAEYNQSSGRFRARTKAGNHNAWADRHGDDYDIVAQLDPDHVPSREFLARTLGYFRDSNVAFVVAPQVYGNRLSGYVPRAAASQAFVFHGIVQRGGNAMGTPLLIGTNHVYRMSAWRQIGGYQDSIIEDHLTSMVVHGTENPQTGQRWKGVYTPDIIAVGDGPETWTDFFQQQERWASGVWQIALRRRGQTRALRTPRRVRAYYAFLRLFYPSIGISWMAGVGICVLQVSGSSQGALACEPSLSIWFSWLASMVSWVLLFRWLRRWNLHPRERAESVLVPWIATVLAAPVYAKAAVSSVFRRDIGYVVTGKGDLRSRDCSSTFAPHLATAVLLVTGLAVGGVVGGLDFAAVAWALAVLAPCLALPAASLWVRSPVAAPEK